MESRKSVVIVNMIDVEVDTRTSSMDSVSTKQSCHLCDTGKEETSRHGIGNRILLALPVCLVIIPALFISIAFTLAHVKGTMKLPPTRTTPYISDLGADEPQGSFFTLGLTIGAFFTAAVVIVRYVQVKSTVENIGLWINLVGLVFGILIVVGQVMVASFRLAPLTSVHYFGAVLYAVSGVIYAPIQTYISHKEKHYFGRRYRDIFLCLRVLLSAGVSLGFVIFGLFLIPPLVQYNRPGYSVAQAGEWSFAVFKMLFMLTFIVDFWKLQPNLLISST